MLLRFVISLLQIIVLINYYKNLLVLLLNFQKISVQKSVFSFFKN